MNGSGDCRVEEELAIKQPRWLFLRAIIARNITLKFISELAARAIQFAFIIVAARRLGPRGFGTYSFAVALGFVLAQFCDLGLQLYVARELASAPGRRAQILGAALWCKLTLLAAGIAFLVTYVWMQAGIAQRDVLFILALAVILTSQLELLNYAFRGYQRLEFEAGLILASRILGPGMAIPFLLWGASLRIVAWNLLLANLAAIMLGFYWLTRYFTSPDLRVSRAEWRQALTQALPLGIAILSSALYTRMGILLLSRLTSLDNAGLFNAALRLTEPLQLIPAIALAAIYPAFAGQEPGRQGILARRTLQGLFALGVVLASGGWLGAHPIVAAVYGSAFQSSTAALRWLALALVPMFLNYALTHFIIARGRPWLNASFTLIILFENLLLNLWLIPQRGVAGASLSLLISELTFFGLCAFGFRLAMRAGASASGAKPYGPHDLEGL
jgi:O-antigen/teichoic acid export membrane protein